MTELIKTKMYLTRQDKSTQGYIFVSTRSHGCVEYSAKWWRKQYLERKKTKDEEDNIEDSRQGSFVTIQLHCLSCLKFQIECIRRCGSGSRCAIKWYKFLDIIHP
jgi:hypothetical protein